MVTICIMPSRDTEQLLDIHCCEMHRWEICLILAYANNKGADKPVNAQYMISTFSITSLVLVDVKRGFEYYQTRNKLGTAYVFSQT